LDDYIGLTVKQEEPTEIVATYSRVSSHEQKQKGEFKLSPNKQLTGRGCSKCGVIERGKRSAERRRKKLNIVKIVVRVNKFYYFCKK
jgi:hypothetical protein